MKIANRRKFDRYDMTQILTRNVKVNADLLLMDLQNIVMGYLNDSLRIVEPTPDEDKRSIGSFNFVVNVPLEKTLKEMVFSYINENKDTYNIDSTIDSIYIIFRDGEKTFKIPLNISMCGDDMIYSNRLRFGVWLNTYVAKEIV